MFDFTVNRTFLRRVDIFSGLPEIDLDRILEIVQERNFRKDEVIFHADDPSGTLFILKAGSVRISIRDKVRNEDITKILSPFDYFGEMSILDGRHRPATVTAIEKSRALLIDRNHFIRLITIYPQVALNVLVLLRRMIKTDKKIAGFRFETAQGKKNTRSRTSFRTLSESGDEKEPWPRNSIKNNYSI